MNLDEALKLEMHPRQDPERRAPEGWERGHSFDHATGTGTLSTGAVEGEPTEGVWLELIADWGLDPERVQVVPGSVQVRGWDAPVGGGEVRRLRYYRATIVDRTVQRADVADVIAACKRRKPRAKGVVVTEHPALVVSLNDWQIGKGEGGGSVATVEAITSAWQQVLAHLRDLSKLGRRPSSVVLANTGDLVEQTSGHYPSQQFTVDLTLRDQVRVATRLLMSMVDDLVTLGYPVTVTAVPCNHGEFRGGSGKAYTTPSDNLSLMIVEHVQLATDANPDRYGHVTYAYAQDLTLVMDVCGVHVGMTHGHQIRGGGTGAAKMARWWQGQVMGNEPVAAADILMAAHLHHLEVSEETGRTIILAPASDGGSYWYTAQTGRTSPRGMLTMLVGSTLPRGWDELRVHTPEVSA